MSPGNRVVSETVRGVVSLGNLKESRPEGARNDGSSGDECGGS